MKILLVVALFVCSCAKPAIDSENLPIVGGQLETGWDGVGLVYMPIVDEPGWYYYCTGTLIDPSWVLTAAHCIKDITSDIFFMTGTDWKSSGIVKKADYYISHPQYSGNSANNDIGVFHLSQPLNTTVREMNDIPFVSNWIGQMVFYVGYGVDDPINDTGDGVKRSGYEQLIWYDNEKYTSSNSFSGTSTCFGDSGGPGFLQVGGKWKIVGVNSHVEFPYCQYNSIQTRVDANLTWIKAQMAMFPKPDASVPKDAGVKDTYKPDTYKPDTYKPDTYKPDTIQLADKAKPDTKPIVKPDTTLLADTHMPEDKEIKPDHYHADMEPSVKVDSGVANDTMRVDKPSPIQPDSLVSLGEPVSKGGCSYVAVNSCSAFQLFILLGIAFVLSFRRRK